MPFYSCAFRSLAPESDALNRAEDEDGGKRSSLLLLSRLIREKACRWLSNNLTPIYNGINKQTLKNSSEKSVLVESWRLMPHLRLSFSLILELAAVSDLADETLVQNKLFDTLLDQFWTCVSALDDPKEKETAMLLNGWLWEIVQILREKGQQGLAKRTCSPITWLLWGQGLIKISRNYLIPRPASDQSEATKKHHVALYHYCLDVAATKFQQSERFLMQIVTGCGGNLVPEAEHDLKKAVAETHAALGHINLSKARDSEAEVVRNRLLKMAKDQFSVCYQLDPHHPSCLYNLACVAALLGSNKECQTLLRTAAQLQVLPPLLHVFHDPDLDPVRSQAWFADFLQHVPNEKASSDKSWLYSMYIGMSLLESVRKPTSHPVLNMATPSHAQLHVPRPTNNPQPHTSQPKNDKLQHGTQVQVQPQQQSQPAQQKATAKPNDLTESMIYDEDLNKLQASLARDGFSRSTVVAMLQEVHKQKKANKAQNERFEAAHARLMARLEAAGMKQKSVIPGDGNCQFHSISDQLFDTLEQSAWVRAKIVEWLRSHGDWELPDNGARLRDFAYEEWDAYCNNMARPGIWGDHLTLTAASHLFGVRIVLFSSIEDNNYVTEYLPAVITSPTVLYLCHYAEYHYGSVCKKAEGEMPAPNPALAH